jgi:hypothetical protein
MELYKLLFFTAHYSVPDMKKARVNRHSTLLTRCSSIACNFTMCIGGVSVERNVYVHVCICVQGVGDSNSALQSTWAGVFCWLHCGRKQRG